MVYLPRMIKEDMSKDKMSCLVMHSNLCVWKDFPSAKDDLPTSAAGMRLKGCPPAHNRAICQLWGISPAP